MKVKIKQDEWYPVVTPAKPTKPNPNARYRYPREIEVSWIFWIVYVGVHKLFYSMWQKILNDNDLWSVE